MHDPARPLLDPPGAPMRWHRYVCADCGATFQRSEQLLPLPPEVDPPARLRLYCRCCARYVGLWPGRTNAPWHTWESEVPAPAPGEW